MKIYFSEKSPYFTKNYEEILIIYLVLVLKCLYICKAEALEKFPGPRNLKRIVLLKNRNTRYGTLDMWKPMIIWSSGASFWVQASLRMIFPDAGTVNEWRMYGSRISCIDALEYS